MAKKYGRTGPKSGDVYGKQSAQRGGKKYVPPKAVRDEPDPEWRQWFTEVGQRRQDQKDRDKRRWRSAEVEKESRIEKIARNVGAPTQLGKTVKKALPERVVRLSVAYSQIAALWERAVGAEIAGESELYSFKAGVLTMTIFSSTLLQEIRQFHASAILADLRDIWTVDTSLLGVKYRIGERGGG